MLGALALLALSTTAEEQDKALDLAGKDILMREVRDAKVVKKKRKSKPGRERTSGKKDKKTKGKGQSRRRKGKGKGKAVGSSRKKNGGKRRGNTKGKEGKGRRRTRKGGKSPQNGRNTRQDTCATFYDQFNTAAVRDFRYARNQIQKAKRAKNMVEKLDKLTEKAATAFLAGAAFFKSCSDPRAPAIYDGLSKCNVTAASLCNPADLKNTTAYEDINVCITALENTMFSSENCLSKPACGEGSNGDGQCAYDPIGMVNRTCDYVQFGKDVAERLNKNCTASNDVGSFTYCNNLLKDNFDVISNCSWCPLVTTLAPSAGRLRKALNIWNI